MKRGFTLIELVVVILIIGIIATIGVPRFFRSPVSVTEKFIGSLNVLVKDGVGEAHRTGTVQRIFFNWLGRTVEVQSIDGKTTIKGIGIPGGIDVNDVLISGKSQFIGGGGEKRTFYFLINPDGITQEVSLILIDEAVRARSPGRGEYEFYLNPFTAVFRLR